MNSGQRGWKGQPAGRLNGCGIEPPSVASLRARRRHDARDRAQQRARVGMLRRVEDVVDRPFSTARPRYITTTSSAISAITPMSWVIRISARPRCCCRPRSRSRICAWVVTSSAVVGSSAISTRGSQASAIAIITRWRRPPLSWNGYSSTRRSGMRHADHAQQLDRALVRLVVRRVAVLADRLHDLVADRVVVAERGHRLLEDQRDLLAADRAHLRAVGRKLREVDPPQPSAAFGSQISPASMRPGRSTMPRMLRAVMLLPQPLSPTMPSVRPGRTSKLTPSTARTTPSSR